MGGSPAHAFNRCMPERSGSASDASSRAVGERVGISENTGASMHALAERVGISENTGASMHALAERVGISENTGASMHALAERVGRICPPYLQYNLSMLCVSAR
ncbi:hypothetical protein GCM10027318_14900 [Massilia agilis]